MLATRIGSLYQRHPIRMNVLTGGCLAGAADIVCQKWVEDVESIDLRRLGALTAFGCAYTGGACIYIYRSYNYIVPLTSPHRAFYKTVIDNFVHCPLIYTPTFYITTGIMQGQNFEQAREELVSRYWETTIACWLFWVPVMWGNFSLLPANMVVLSMQCSNLVWNVILDYIAHRTHEVLENISLDPKPPIQSSGGAQRGVNILVDSYKKELATSFQKLNQQLIEKDKTINQLHYQLDTLQARFDQLEREHAFSNRLHSLNTQEFADTAGKAAS